jgi:hypothetical protein
MSETAFFSASQQRLLNIYQMIWIARVVRILRCATDFFRYHNLTWQHQV